MFLTTALAAAGPAGGAQQTGNPLLNFLPLFAIIIIMYLLMILPQQRRQKEHAKMLENLKNGDRVVTSGGIFGNVTKVNEKEKTIVLKIADNTKIEILRSSVAQVLKN